MPFNPFDDQPVSVKAKAGLTFALLIAANVVAWAWAWAAFSSHPTLMGIAFLAYMLGIRHAFDADHIAAIDNVVRKLMQDGKAPYSAGLFFSFGHSSIVILASIAVAGAASAMQGRIQAFSPIGSIIGTSVSAAFLLVIGIANLFILRGTWGAFTRARRGEPITDQDLDMLASGGGFLTRIFRPMFQIVSRSWHMYPIGFLFGLGFDTATEIALIGISASQAAQGMQMINLLVFPALFTAGMTLMDTADSTLMTRAYGWAFINPVRKLWYNLTTTAASVIVALFIGGVEAVGLLAEKLDAQGRGWAMIGELNEDLANFGFIIVGIFIVSWLVSMAVYQAKGYDSLQPESA